MEDADILFRWRNDASSRAHFRLVAEVSRDDHLKWMTWSLNDQFVRMLIAEEGGIPVGMVRIDEENNGNLLTWLVAPEHRRRGYGYAVARAAVDATPGRIKTEIAATNIPAIKIAKAAGLAKSRVVNGIAYYELEPDGYQPDPLAALRHL